MEPRKYPFLLAEGQQLLNALFRRLFGDDGVIVCPECRGEGCLRCQGVGKLACLPGKDVDGQVR